MSDKMSFLPEDFVERRVEQRTNLLCLSLFIVVLCGIVGAQTLKTRQRSEVRKQHDEVNTAYAEAAKRIEQLEDLQQRREQMLRKAQVTATLLEPVPRSFLLADLVNRMPAALSLLELSLTTKAAAPVFAPVAKTALAGATQADTKPQEPPVPKSVSTLAMVGVAPTDVQVAQFMSKLSQSPLLSDVNLIYSEETKVVDTNMRKFRIEMTLSEKADVRAIEAYIPARLPRNPVQIDTPGPAGKE